MKLIYVSILNWNDASSTITCVKSILDCVIPAGHQLRILVIDNGSLANDKSNLLAGLASAPVKIQCLPENLGFASGHNVAVEKALQDEAEFIWLVNNDAVVSANTLVELADELSADPTCGIVSPLIFALDDDRRVDFVGAMQDWDLLDSRRAPDPETARQMQAESPSEFFVYGTAPLIRIAALRSIGSLAANYFAYYEDEEFCARLAKNGWSSKMAFNSKIQHRHQPKTFVERPPYYFYLMARNSLHFYLEHTPHPHRRLITLRLFSRAMIKAAKLRESGQAEKCNACLLGIFDGLRGRSGHPQLNRLPPTWLVGVSKVFPYRLQQWLG